MIMIRRHMMKNQTKIRYTTWFWSPSAPTTPSGRGRCPRISTRPNSSASPCTPRVSSGSHLFQSTLARETHLRYRNSNSKTRLGGAAIVLENSETPFFTDSDNDALHIDFTQRLCHTLLSLLAKDIHNRLPSKNVSKALRSSDNFINSSKTLSLL